MRASAVPLALAFAALGACHHQPRPAATSGAALPDAGQTARTPGLWIEQATGKDGVFVTRYCLDARSDRQLSYLGGQLNGQCERHVMATDAQGIWHFSTLCGAGQDKVATEGVIHGDFARHYQVEATVALAGQPPSAATQIKADVRWAGLCPADMKPGDVVLPGAERTQVSTLGAARTNP